MSLLNKAEVRKLALGVAEVRSDKFKRVSKKFIDDLDAYVDNVIRESVRNHPSVGKTITELFRMK